MQARLHSEPQAEMCSVSVSEMRSDTGPALLRHSVWAWCHCQMEEVSCVLGVWEDLKRGERGKRAMIRQSWTYRSAVWHSHLLWPWEFFSTDERGPGGVVFSNSLILCLVRSSGVGRLFFFLLILLLTNLYIIYVISKMYYPEIAQWLLDMKFLEIERGGKWFWNDHPEDNGGGSGRI